MRGLIAIEKYFKMSFVDVINKLHIEKEMTILELSNLCGISRDTFQRQVKKHGLKIRNPKEARAILIRDGVCSRENHWAWGLRKETSAWARMHSTRMKRNNPSFDKNIRIHLAKKYSEIFINNPRPQEVLASQFLNELNIEYEFQKPIDVFIVDFFLIKSQVCLEIDSTRKWGKEQYERANKRDKIIENLGYKTVRINKAHLSLEFMHDVLSANNII